MQCDSYSLTSNSALFVLAGSAIPPLFAQHDPKLVKRDAYFNDPVLIADIEKQGWHVLKIIVSFEEIVGVMPPR